MTDSTDEGDGAERSGAEITLRFVTTLIVTTLMVGVTAFVLSYAVLAPERQAQAHGSAAVLQHARS